jgi:hypothetical protein
MLLSEPVVPAAAADQPQVANQPADGEHEQPLYFDDEVEDEVLHDDHNFDEEPCENDN